MLQAQAKWRQGSTNVASERIQMASRFVASAERASAGHLLARFHCCWLLMTAVCVAGCGRKSEVPVGKAAESIRKLALAYVQFAATNKGIGPSNKDALATFLAKQNRFSREDADAYFVSPRDNQPYIIRWGLRPLSSTSIGPDVPEPAIIIIERTGADGIRYVADGQLGIRQLSDEELNEAVPDLSSTTGR
jgi:hypothetical protein